MPGVCVPSDLAVYMPLALNINPMNYLQGLYSACILLADELSATHGTMTEVRLRKETVNCLGQLTDDYDAVIICLGAKAVMLPELAGKLPLRTCRGVIATFHSQCDTLRSESPSILSDAWLAFHGPHDITIGSTWQWKSCNYASTVDTTEALLAIEELLPKAAAVYPEISNWSYVGARAGVRAMPPVTERGGLPLLGCVNNLIGSRSNCMVWFAGGLGARGLVYHGLVGKLTARAVVARDENVIPTEFICWK